MFVGREQELASLEEFYAKDGIGMTVIYGRRRIGKSTLITEFVKDKKTVFYTATKIGKTRNLELFSKQVLDLFMPGIENISFNSIEAVFDFIDKNIGEQWMQRHCLCIQKMLIPFEQSTHCDQLARFYCGRYQHSKYQCLLPFYLPVHDQRQQRSRWQKQNTIQCSFRKSGCLFRMGKTEVLTSNT